MTYYYASKEEAKRVAESLDDDRILYTKVELEPSNGWVVVIVPRPVNLTEYGDRFEVRDQTGKRLVPRPNSYRRPLDQPPPRAAKPARPAEPKTVKTVILPGGVLPWLKS